jgi:cytoskeletal protein RodZ
MRGEPSRNGRRVPPDEEPPGASLPERLYAARERKGVDLYRAERDTKIRTRYLAALERGDWRELPGAVYTKGFLRNYALYLGLDPEEVLAQWRRERGDAAAPQPVLAIPRPLAAPRPAFTLSPWVVVAALLTLLVIAFVAYLGVQLLRFAKPPTISLTDPIVAVLEVEETQSSYTLKGTATPGVSVEIATPGRDQPYRVSVGPDGAWSANVDLRRGKNQFEITARDPETGKVAEAPIRLVITVPFLVIVAPTLSVDQPQEGATYENGAIPVSGRATNATSVQVSVASLDAPEAAASPAADASPSPAPGFAPIDVSPDETGAFSTPVELTAGRWAITVTAASSDGKAVSITRTVSITYKGVNLAIQVKGGRAWLKVWIDGAVSDVTGSAGRIYSDGKTLTFTAESTIEVRTGKASVTYFTLNGVNLGRLSERANPETWLFAPPEPPTKTNRR